MTQWYDSLVGDVATFLARGYAAPDEEYLARFVFAYPHLCTFYYGDYASTISNRGVFADNVEAAFQAVQRAHDHSLHGIAIAGYRTFLAAACQKRSLPAHIADVYHWLQKLFIHLYYVDRVAALAVARTLLRARDRHVYLSHRMTSDEAYIKYLFSFVDLAYPPAADTVDTSIVDTNTVDTSITAFAEAEAVLAWVAADEAQWLRLKEIPTSGTGEGSEWGATFRAHFHHFAELQRIVSRCKTGMTGSYLMHHDLRYEPALQTKQTNLFNLVRNHYPDTLNILEVGVNAAHSLLIMLLANPRATIVAFDICEYDHTEPCIAYLNRQFHDRIVLIKGASPYTLATYLADHPDYHFDLAHLDGLHDWKHIWDEILLCGRVARPGDHLILDDMNLAPHCLANLLVPVVSWLPDATYANSAYRFTARFPSSLLTNDLAGLADRYGSDKCPQRRHNYTTVYHSLFHDRRNQIHDVLEVGIGFPAIMGERYITGASLFMWRDYFPQANIMGLDINRNTLFGSDRIQCYYADQSDPASFRFLRDHQFDVIIDDGSHVVGHQILTLKHVFRCLKPGGVYVIEDLNVYNVDWLREANLDANWVEKVEEFHLDSHDSDDRLAILWKRASPL